MYKLLDNTSFVFKMSQVVTQIFVSLAQRRIVKFPHILTEYMKGIKKAETPKALDLL